MNRSPCWINRIPVLSTAHVTRSTMEWLREIRGRSNSTTVASYPEREFIYLTELGEADSDRVVDCRWHEG